MSGEFSGKHVLVTGGTKGIGRACVLELAARGARLTATYSRDEGAARKLSETGVRVVKADMGEPDRPEQLIASLERAGELPDVLVCNAAFQRKATVDQTDRRLMEKTFGVNVFGNFQLARSWADALGRAGRRGVLVIHSSNQSELVNPTAFAYALSKAALNHMVRHLAVAYAGRGIRVNGILFGWFDTEGERAFYSGEQMRSGAEGILLGRIGEPREAARLVAYVAGDDAAYMTGSLVRIDGGYVLAPDLSL